MDALDRHGLNISRIDAGIVAGLFRVSEHPLGKLAPLAGFKVV